MYKNRRMQNGRSQSIMNFVKPYAKRKQFCPTKNEIPDGFTLDIFIFYRFFNNPALDGYTSFNLHQYHILFNLLENELKIMETEMQGIDLKIVLFSPLTCSNMCKFLN